MVSWKSVVTGTKAEVTWGGIVGWTDWWHTGHERQTTVLTSRILLRTRLHTTYDQLNWVFKSTALRTSLTLTLLAEVSGDNCEDSQFSLGTYCTHCASLLNRKKKKQVKIRQIERLGQKRSIPTTELRSSSVEIECYIASKNSDHSNGRCPVGRSTPVLVLSVLHWVGFLEVLYTCTFDMHSS